MARCNRTVPGFDHRPKHPYFHLKLKILFCGFVLLNFARVLFPQSSNAEAAGQLRFVHKLAQGGGSYHKYALPSNRFNTTCMVQPTAG